MKKAEITFCCLTLLNLFFAKITQALTPSDISGLTVWYKPETLQLNNNDPVSSWTDSSGNGFTLFQTDTAKQPKYTFSGINNLPTITFSGHQELIIDNNLCSQLTDQTTLFIVAGFNDFYAAASYNLIDTNPDTGTWWRYVADGRSYLGVFRPVRVESFTTMPQYGTHIFTLKSGIDYTFYIDREFKNTVTGNFSCGEIFGIGGMSGGIPLTGDISEIIVYNTTLPDPDRTNVENYLFDKFFIPFPEIGPISVSANPIIINSGITATADFSDQNSSNTHYATWDWGDGNTTNGTVIESNGSGSISAGHTYTIPGIYNIKLTLMGNNSKFQTVNYKNLMVYDTNAGRVQAGNEFISPQEAVIQNPSVTGDANFNFTAKYINGVPEAIGNKWAKLSIQGETTSYNFTADSYQVLIVKDNKVILTGMGILNGASGYSFFINASSGGKSSNDYIRFQITGPDKNIVYDTQPDAPISADPATLVTKGKITIH